MQHVSSLGGPRVMLPRNEVQRWLNELGESPRTDEGLYGMACSVMDYCGIISPWQTPLLIFGDDPADLYYRQDIFDGLLFRWVAANSLNELTEFAIAQATEESWDEVIEFKTHAEDYTLMDACAFSEEASPRVQMRLRPGIYRIESRYAETPELSTIIHRFQFLS